jgi:hypothetical protein
MFDFLSYMQQHRQHNTATQRSYSVNLLHRMVG